MTSHRVHTLVLPIFRRYWLWHAWSTEAAAAAPQAARTWRQGANLEEKFHILGQNITTKVRTARSPPDAACCAAARPSCRRARPPLTAPPALARRRRRRPG